jgi:hypothetical protein
MGSANLITEKYHVHGTAGAPPSDFEASVAFAKAGELFRNIARTVSKPPETTKFQLRGDRQSGSE